MAKRKKCPHCGNTNPNTILSNGLPETHPDLTWLCVARVEPGEDSFDAGVQQPEADGLVPCGMQWEPFAD